MADPRMIKVRTLTLLGGKFRTAEIFDIRPLGKRTIEFYERLDTKAPSPALCHPFCCYINTVIFYANGYPCEPGINAKLRWYAKTRKKSLPADGVPKLGVFIEYDRVKTLMWDDVIAIGGGNYQVQGGTVVWLGKGQRWAMRRKARLQREQGQ